MKITCPKRKHKSLSTR